MGVYETSQYPRPFARSAVPSEFSAGGPRRNVDIILIGDPSAEYQNLYCSVASVTDSVGTRLTDRFYRLAYVVVVV